MILNQFLSLFLISTVYSIFLLLHSLFYFIYLLIIFYFILFVFQLFFTYIDLMHQVIYALYTSYPYIYIHMHIFIHIRMRKKLSGGCRIILVPRVANPIGSWILSSVGNYYLGYKSEWLAVPRTVAFPLAHSHSSSSATDTVFSLYTHIQ